MGKGTVNKCIVLIFPHFVRLLFYSPYLFSLGNTECVHCWRVFIVGVCSFAFHHSSPDFAALFLHPSRWFASFIPLPIIHTLKRALTEIQTHKHTTNGFPHRNDSQVHLHSNTTTHRPPGDCLEAPSARLLGPPPSPAPPPRPRVGRVSLVVERREYPETQTRPPPPRDTWVDGVLSGQAAQSLPDCFPIRYLETFSSIIGWPYCSVGNFKIIKPSTSLFKPSFHLQDFYA